MHGVPIHQRPRCGRWLNPDPMNKLIAISLATVLSLSEANAASALAQKSPSKAASELNSQSKRSLGVTIRALAFLFDGGTILLKSSLMEDGSLEQLKSLEKAGYVKTHLVTNADGEFVQIEVTAKGASVLLELRRQ
jgi:hypothetical protein